MLRNALGGLVLAVATAIVSVSQVRCGGPCTSYGPGTYQATASYTGQLGTTPLTGAMPVTITNAFTEQFHGGSCTYENVELTMQFDSCTLYGHVTDESWDSKEATFIGASGVLDPGQSCTLQLVTGPVTMTVESGTFDVSPATLGLSLGGSISSEADGGAASGFLSLTAK